MAFGHTRVRNDTASINPPRRTLARNNTAVKQQGFTLIELVIVLLIIGIVTTFAVLSFGDFGRSQSLKENLNVLQSQIRYAQTRALLTQQPLSLQWQAHGYTFYQRQHNQWRAITTKPLNPRRLKGINIQATKTVLISPAMPSTFTAKLSLASGRGFQLTGNHDGTTSLNALPSR